MKSEAEAKHLYSKDGEEDKLFTDAQIAVMGEGADGWKRKNAPRKPAELSGSENSKASKPEPASKEVKPTGNAAKPPKEVKPTGNAAKTPKETVATDNVAQTKSSDNGSNESTSDAKGDSTGADSTDNSATGSLPEAAHEKVTGKKPDA